MAHTLELSTETPERSTIAIDGKPYALRAPGELSIIEERLVLGVSNRGSNIAELSDEQAASLESDLNKAVRVVFVDAPNEQIDKLRDPQRFQIITAFWSGATNAAKASQKSKSSRTSSSSRNSKRSTAARSKSGAK